MDDIRIIAEHMNGQRIKYQWSGEKTVHRFLGLVSDAGRELVNKFPRHKDGNVQWERLYKQEKAKARELLGIGQ